MALYTSQYTCNFLQLLNPQVLGLNSPYLYPDQNNILTDIQKSRMRTEGKSIVVVLGMHRSGTSAITRGLMVLGVDLGDHLMPPAPENNKGFFEDVGVNAINVELYKSLGHGQDWHTLAFVPVAELLHEKNAPLRLRAIELLRSRLKTTDCFGLKDPRICRILPFWQSVFEHLQLKVSYIIAVRNPLSVARSLRKRNNLPPEKCHYLWLEHVLPSILLTQGAPRALVDYDLLLDDPQKQIARIAHTLGLVKNLDPIRLIEFSQNFLDGKLRHANFEHEDIFQDPTVPGPVRTAVTLFCDVAADRVSLDSEEAAKIVGDLSKQMEGMSQAMSYLLHLDNVIAGKNHALADRDKHIGILSQRMSELETQLVVLTRTVHDTDKHIVSLNQAAAERDDRIEALIQSGNQKDNALQQSQINVVQLNYRLAQAHASFGWRLFKPARVIGSSLAKYNKVLDVDLIPLARLQRNKSEWLSSGQDAQFLLIAKYPWRRFMGWYSLDMEIIAERSIKTQLNFDTGKGFDSSQAINFFSSIGQQKIPLFISPRCKSIRLDLCDPPAKFDLSVSRLTKLAQAPELSDEFLAQSTVYEALGGREGNVSYLEPMNDVQRHVEADYCWCSNGKDPWFELGDIGKKLRPGWYTVELRIRLDVDRGDAKLYFDYGKGYNESASITLPFSSGRAVKRLCHFVEAPKRTRFDPINTAAKFSVERLHFKPVAPKTARRRMLEYLTSHYTRHKGRSADYVWQDLQVVAKKRKITADELLYQRYNESFSAKGLHNCISYAEWIERFETPRFSDLVGVEKMLQSFKHVPVISVIVATYNTAEIYLRKAIESIVTQSYPYWELCIADDASSQTHVRRILEEYAQREPRIKVIFRRENGHISAASNSALTLASGEYLALVDHDDKLAKHALFFMVEAINQNPTAQILYSDEDKINEQDDRLDPHFKPDWNPDLFFSQNYISHLCVYRRELIQKVRGFRLGVEGSQDQDLLLRCIPHIQPTEILHIPRVLYHWRMVKGSAALAPTEKPYTSEAGVRALTDFLNSQGQDNVNVEAGLLPNTYRVRYPILQPEPLVSLLIPTRDMLEMLEPCIRSILKKTTYQNYEIVILDNESTQPATLDYFQYIQNLDSRVNVLAHRYPFNYSAINNYGVRYAKGELIGLVNNDTEIINPEWLTEMVSHALRPEIGCVGAKLYYEDETIQHAGVIIGIGGVAGHSHKKFHRTAPGYFSRLKIVQNLSAVTGACLVVRKCIYEQVGGLDEAELRIAFNDVDFCLKVRQAGYRNLWTPYAELYHHESQSRGKEDTPAKQARFNAETKFIKTKWGEALRNDPFYSRNLTLVREDFSIRA